MDSFQKDLAKSTDNLDFFYSQMEKNPKMDTYDNFMNLLFKIVANGSVAVVIIILYLHFTQKHQISKYAHLVIQKKEETASTNIPLVGSKIAITVDGQVLEIIKPGLKKEDIELGVKQLELSQHTIKNENILNILKKALQYMIDSNSKKEKVKDYFFYNSEMKKNLKEASFYHDVINKWDLKSDPYGLMYKTNKANVSLL